MGTIAYSVCQERQVELHKKVVGMKAYMQIVTFLDVNFWLRWKLIWYKSLSIVYA